jgi:diguanylate cyclase
MPALDPTAPAGGAEERREAPPAAPSALYARTAIARMHELGVPPTPENYARIYRQLAEPASVAAPEDAGAADAADPLAAGNASAALRLLADRLGARTGKLAGSITADHEQVGEALRGLRNSNNQRDLLFRISEIIATAHALDQKTDAAYTEIVRIRADVEQVAADAQPDDDRIERDALTRIPNRRGLDAILGRAIAHAQRVKKPLTLALVDVDRFSGFNDQYGYHAGDRLLVHLAQLLRSALRRSDIVIRHGADSFAAVLQETDSQAAATVFERVREVLRTQPLDYGGEPLSCTVSAGLAEAGDDETAARFLAQVERALASARARGGDAVIRLAG